MEDVSLLYLDFTVTEDHMGVTETVELAPGGADKLVDNSNVAEYLEANLKYRLHERLKEQLLEMLKGFSEVVPEPLLSVFDFQEIELLLCGLPNIDMDDWIANTEYTGDFAGQGRSNKVVQWFWEVRIHPKTFRAFSWQQAHRTLALFCLRSSGGARNVARPAREALAIHDRHCRSACARIRVPARQRRQHPEVYLARREGGQGVPASTHMLQPVGYAHLQDEGRAATSPHTGHHHGGDGFRHRVTALPCSEFAPSGSQSFVAHDYVFCLSVLFTCDRAVLCIKTLFPPFQSGVLLSGVFAAFLINVRFVSRFWEKQHARKNQSIV